MTLLTCLVARGQTTFKPGLRAGANFSHFTQNTYNNYTYNSYDPTYNHARAVDFSSITDFYIGFYGALKLTKYYTLQPEFDYSRQGSDIKYIDINKVKLDTKFNVSYLSIAVLNKFTFSDKFNVHFGPSIDFVVDQSRNFTYQIPVGVTPQYYDYYSPYNDLDSEVDLAFSAGLGFNFTKNIGIEARVKKGIIPVIDLSDSSHTNVVFSFGATYTFDIK